MSQNDFVIADADGATVLADLNAALQALASISKGASAPGTTYSGQLWWDTGNKVIKIRNDANSAWISVFEFDGTDLKLHADAYDPPDATDGGTDTFTADLRRNIGSDETFLVHFQSANTTTTPTLENTGGNPSGGKTIKRMDGSALTAGDINGVHLCHYDGTDILLLNLGSVYSQSEVDTYAVKAMNDGGTDAYTIDLGTDLASGDTFLGLVDSANTTATPTLENTGGTPAGARSVFDVHGNAWIGMLRNRVHRFQWDGANIVVLDPDGLPATEGVVDATNGGANDLTAIDFTGIGAGAKRITISMDSVSMSGSDDILVQIGDSGGFETSSYEGTSFLFTDSPGNFDSTGTSGFVIRVSSASSSFNGLVDLFLSDSSTNTWVQKHAGERSDSLVILGGGKKSLSAELTQIRITTTGSNTFDNGNVNVLVET